jgi:uncharacterized protein (TIGR02145 family)
MQRKVTFIFILFLAFGFLKAQDLIYTVRGEIEDTSTPLDSILVENLTNKTRILFGNLPDRKDYQVNLTQKAYWGTTGLSPIRDGLGLYILKNLPGNLTIGCQGDITGKVMISVYSLNGQEIYRNNSLRIGRSVSLSVRIGVSGIYLVKFETVSQTETFKAVGLSGIGSIIVSAEDTYDWTPAPKSAYITVADDFSFQKGDSIRISVYKKSYYAYPKSLRIDNSKPLAYKLSLSTAVTTGISDCYVSLEGKAKLAGYDPQTGKTILTYTGEAPGLKYGDIIVVETDTMGYLRKVTGITENDGRATVETRQAFMNEVFVNKEFKLDTRLMKPDILLKSTCSLSEISEAFLDKNGYSHPVVVIYHDKNGNVVKKNMLSDKVQIAEEIPILDYLKDFSNTDIYGKKGDENHFYIDKGNITIKQNAVYDFKLDYTGELDPETKVEEGSLKNFKFYLEGKAGFMVKLALDMKRKYSKEFVPKSIFKKDITTTMYIVGGVPVWIKYNWEIMLGGKAETTDSLHAECGYESNHTIRVGCQYNGETGEFAPLTSYDSANVIYPLKTNLDLTASVRLDIYPRINAKFYNSLGPFVEVVPFVEGNVTGKTQTQETTTGTQSFLAWNSVINLGLDLRTGLKLEFLKLIDKTFGPVGVNCFKTPLWKSPLKIALKDTLPHTAVPGTKLMVTFKVTDKYGIPAPFSYIYIKGFGTFSQELVKSDLLGEATITWTLRGTEDFDVFIATVYNADKTIATDMTGSVLVKAESTSGTFTDSRDGYVYKWIKIYDMIWMAENLTYLPAVSDSMTGSNTDKHYYVLKYGGTDVGAAKASNYYKVYGALYNWPAAMNGQPSSSTRPSGVRGICPAGWHLPSVAEWFRLADILITNIGGKMKEAGYDHWKQPNSGATNASGFTALPGGYRWYYWNGNFLHIGEEADFWTSTESDADKTMAWSRILNHNQTALFTGSISKSSGYSVRCVKD